MITNYNIPHFRIEPSSKFSLHNILEVLKYRDLIWLLVTRNIKGNYRQMALGPVWILIKPLLQMVVFSVIFGVFAKLPSEGVPYPIFTFSALIPWTYFSSATTESIQSLIAQMPIISKVYFPRLVVPISAVISGLVDMAAAFGILLVMMLIYGFNPTWLFF